MITIIRTLNLNRETTAILQNAYNIGYEKQVNAIWQASFSLPLNDPKVDKVELLKYVEIMDGDEYIGLFRIIPKLTIKSETTNEVRFQCEHVLATLLDSSLFQYHQLTNYTTEDVLQYLFDRQKHKHWRKGKVDYKRYFHYGWENTNLITSMFSVPKPFDEPYIWEHDTRSYPWTLDLVIPDDKPICRIKEGYNLIGLEIEENPMGVYNRIYPLGAGEGVNQLTIKSVNNGVPYLEDRKPGEEIKEYIWADKRFTDAASLKASAAALLKKWKEPIVTWKVSAADVSSITGLSIDKFKVGKVVRLDIKGFPVTDLRIMKESKPDIKGDPGNVLLEIGNVQEDLGTTNADLERRQQINELYSQGATNILNFGYQDNADNKIPALIPFYVDDDVVNINTCELTFRTKKFRTYSETTENAGQLVKSVTTGGGGKLIQAITSGGGGKLVQTVTSRGGGELVKAMTTEGGGGNSPTSAAGGDHRHQMFSGTGFANNPNPDQSVLLSAANGMKIHVNGETSAAASFFTEGSSGNHSHTVTIAPHTHPVNVQLPNHTHPVDIQLPNHTHPIDIQLPNHTHPLEIEIPGHVHGVVHKIIELDEMPSSVSIKVDGNLVNFNGTSGNRINLVDYMRKDSDGKISRGEHEIEILPSGRARIEADLILRVFIQSRLGGNY